MAGVRDRLAALCNQLAKWDTLDGIIRAGDAGDALDELLASCVAANADSDTAQAAKLLDAIDEACAKQGIGRVSFTARGTAYRPLPASSTAASAAWVCPTGSCDRVVFPDEANSDPVCALAGGATMKRFQVPA